MKCEKYSLKTEKKNWKMKFSYISLQDVDAGQQHFTGDIHYATYYFGC